LGRISNEIGTNQQHNRDESAEPGYAEPPMLGHSGRYYDRFVEAEFRDALADTPVVALNGARQVGKSTLARHLAERYDGPVHVVTLDDPTQLAAARSDPVSFVDRDGLLGADGHRNGFPRVAAPCRAPRR
jgi:hypothetical protein